MAPELYLKGITSGQPIFWNIKLKNFYTPSCAQILKLPWLIIHEIKSIWDTWKKLGWQLGRKQSANVVFNVFKDVVMIVVSVAKYRACRYSEWKCVVDRWDKECGRGKEKGIWENVTKECVRGNILEKHEWVQGIEEESKEVNGWK